MTANTGTLQITELTAEHAQDVLAIYQLGIDEGNATFERSLTAAPARAWWSTPSTFIPKPVGEESGTPSSTH